jgi:hypothetical protein
MDPNAKRTKTKARKSIFGEGRSTGQGGKHVPLLPADIQTAWRDEEDLVDYEPEEPAAYSPIQGGISVQGDHTPTLEEGPHDFSPNTDNFPHFRRRMAIWRGGSVRNFSGASYTPSPPQFHATANTNVDDIPLLLAMMLR